MVAQPKLSRAARPAGNRSELRLNAELQSVKSTAAWAGRDGGADPVADFGGDDPNGGDVLADPCPLIVLVQPANTRAPIDRATVSGRPPTRR
jgi:hypothetical protein